MPAVAVDKVSEHLHAAHDALAWVVGRWQPSPAGSVPMGRDRKPVAVPGGVPLVRHRRGMGVGGVPAECSLAWRPLRGSALPDGGASPEFRPGTQGGQEEELEGQMDAVEEDIRHLWRQTASAPSRISGAARPRT